MKEMRENNNREKGQSLMELAISLVVLLILLAGVVDLGRAFFTYITLRDAAQEGASYAAVAEDDPITDVAGYCSAIADRVIITTSELDGGVSSGPIDLVAMDNAGNVSVETQITRVDKNGVAYSYECTDTPPADICLGSAVQVEVTYDSFPMTMPFMGTIIGSQTISLNANVIDTILTPACKFEK
jgi:Flp pilus assembly protein TadG